MKKPMYRIVEEHKPLGYSIYIVQKRSAWYNALSFNPWYDYNVFPNMKEALGCIKMLTEDTATTFHYFDEKGDPIETATGVTNGTSKPI